MMGTVVLSVYYAFKRMKLACKDLNPTTTCNFEVDAATREDAAQQMLAHAKEVHAADIEGQSDEAVRAMMEGKVRE